MSLSHICFIELRLVFSSLGGDWPQYFISINIIQARTGFPEGTLGTCCTPRRVFPIRKYLACRILKAFVPAMRKAMRMALGEIPLSFGLAQCIGGPIFQKPEVA